MPDSVWKMQRNDSLFVLSNIFIVDSDSRLSISVIRSLILPGNPSVLSTHWVEIFLIGAYKFLKLFLQFSSYYTVNNLIREKEYFSRNYSSPLQSNRKGQYQQLVVRHKSVQCRPSSSDPSFSCTH